MQHSVLASNKNHVALCLLQVQRMAATSQYHANTLSSSLEALKKPQRSAPQVHRLQGRQRDHLLCPFY